MPIANAPWPRLHALALVFCLAGCAHPVAPAPYAAPLPSKATARLLMRGTLDAGDTYRLSVYQDAQSCTGGRVAGVGTASEDPQGTTLVAGMLQTVEVRLAKPARQTCTMNWSFIPVAGHSYLVSARSEPGGCASLVYDATRPDALHVEPTLRRRDAGRVACVPLSLSRAAAGAASAGGSKPAVSEDDLQGLIGH